MQRSATVLLVTLSLAPTSCATNPKAAPTPRAPQTADSQSYAAELLARIAKLERDVDEEAKARLSERTAAAATLAKSKKEMASRLGTISEELHKREVELNRSEDSTKELRDRSAQCSSDLDTQRKKASSLEAEARAAAAALAESRGKASAAEASANAASAETVRQRDSAARESERAKELQTRLDESTRRVAVLEHELTAKKEQPIVASAESSKTDQHEPYDSIVKDLQKARAEIDRLNALNIEQQALLDERYGLGAPEGEPHSPKATAKQQRIASANRARAAAPIAPRADRDQPPRAHAEAANELQEALARREQIQHEIARLEGSPMDPSAPARAAELATDLDSTNREIRRLAVLLNVEGGPMR